MRSFTSIAQQICLDKDFTPYQLSKESYSSVDAVKRLKSYVVELRCFTARYGWGRGGAGFAEGSGGASDGLGRQQRISPYSAGGERNIWAR